jgi:hypothetical protein
MPFSFYRYRYRHVYMRHRLGYLPIFADGSDDGVADFVVNQQRCLCIEDPFDATDNVARTVTKDQVCLYLNAYACSYQVITFSRL